MNTAPMRALILPSGEPSPTTKYLESHRKFWVFLGPSVALNGNGIYSPFNKAPRRRANVPGPGHRRETSMTRRIMKRMLALGGVLALLLCGSAQAAPFPPELEADYAAALAWWGVSSPPQCASV